MAAAPSLDELKSPLEEFCEKELKAYGDIDESTRQTATESIQRVCESPYTDSDEDLIQVKSRSISSCSSRPTTRSSNYKTDDLLTDSDWNDPVDRTLRFMNHDILNTPVEEQQTKFKGLLESYRKKNAESSLSEFARRFRAFMMLTTAREYFAQKWRSIRKTDAKPSIEEVSEDSDSSRHADNNSDSS